MSLFTRKKSARYNRKLNSDIYISLSRDIEKSFADYILSKSIVNEEYIEYKYHFKSEHIEFDLSFDSHFIAYMSSSRKWNHYHFDSWSSKSFVNSIVINELSNLLNGNVLFADIYKNGKFYSVWYENISISKNEDEFDIKQIIEEFFNENGFPKGTYLLKLYGNKKINELKVEYINTKRSI